MSREPFAENEPPDVEPQPVNPANLANVPADQVAAYLRHLGARAIGGVLEGQDDDGHGSAERRT